MTNQNLRHARLAGQRIIGAACEAPREAVRLLGAVQAQDYAGSLWAIGMRMDGATVPGGFGATEDVIEMEIAERAIIRTWALRGTLHFVAAEDLRWILTLAGPHVVAGNALRYRQLELDEKILTAAESILVRTLRDGRQLVRKELAAALQGAGISPAGQRMVYMLQKASLDRLICFGVRRGKEFTHRLLDEEARAAGNMERDRALAELAVRYFMSHGPATLQDYTWWSGLPAAAAREGLESVKGSLAREAFGGETYWLAPHRAAANRALPHGKPAHGKAAPGRAVRPGPAAAWLLPCFDEYIVGYKDRRAILDARHAARSGNGLLHPAIAVGGRIAGTWKRTIKRSEVVVSVDPFSPLSKAEAGEVSAAVTRYGDFLKLPAVLS
jgi:hypothetical protein